MVCDIMTFQTKEAHKSRVTFDRDKKMRNSNNDKSNTDGEKDPPLSEYIEKSIISPRPAAAEKKIIFVSSQIDFRLIERQNATENIIRKRWSQSHHVRRPCRGADQPRPQMLGHMSLSSLSLSLSVSLFDSNSPITDFFSLSSQKIFFNFFLAITEIRL